MEQSEQIMNILAKHNVEIPQEALDELNAAGAFGEAWDSIKNAFSGKGMSQAAHQANDSPQYN